MRLREEGIGPETVVGGAAGAGRAASSPAPAPIHQQRRRRGEARRNRAATRRVAIVIPARDEAATIATVVRGLTELPAGTFTDLIVVDDGSRDRTGDLARDAGAIVVTHDRHRGKGNALRAGFAAALERGADVVVTLDADLQHDPAELPRLLAAARSGGLDLLVGYRRDRIRQSPPQNLLVNWLMSLLLAATSGARLRDSQCGYRVHASWLLRSMRLRTGAFDTETEVILEARRLGARIGEAPVRTIYIPGRKSWIRPTIDSLRFFRVLLDR